MAHLGDDTIGRTAVHEVVVLAVTHLRRERHAFGGIIIKLGAGVVIPVDAPALDGLQDALEILEVRLLHQLMLTPTVHLAVLDGA